MQALRQRQQAHQSQHQHLSATQQMAMLNEGGMGGMGSGLLGNQVGYCSPCSRSHFCGETTLGFRMVVPF